MKEYLDRTPGQVNQLTQALDRLGDNIQKASQASEQHAKSLVRATWVLAVVTIVLVVVTAMPYLRGPAP